MTDEPETEGDKETPASKDAQAEKKAPARKKPPAAEQTAAEEKTPAEQATPAVKATPAENETPVAHEGPVAKEAPAESAEAPTTTAAGPKRKRLSRTRAVVTWVLIVLASLMVPLSVITYWAVNTTTNTDHYVETMAPLAREKVITDFIATRATQKIFAAVQVQHKVQSALPKKAAFLAAPLVNEVQGYVQTQMMKLLSSTYFHNLWDTANRRSHAAVVAVLTGKSNPKVKKANDVIVDITPVIDKAINQLDAKGITIFDGVKPKLDKANTLTVNLVSGEQISKARNLFRVVTNLRWAIPIVALILIAAAVAVATDRRKALLRVAVGAGLATLGFLIALTLGRNFFVDHASSKVDPAVTTAAFTTITRFLTEGLKWVILVCVVVALALWLAGPSSWARWIRAQVARAARWLWTQAKALGGKENRGKATTGAKRAAAWTLVHKSGMRIAGAVVAGLVIVFGGNLSVSGVWDTLIVLAIYLVLLELVMIWARRTAGRSPSGPTSVDDGGGTAPPATVSSGGDESAARN